MLAIAGGKGGVGKTTTALGLAAALPDRPLVVDADRDMPDLHALAGVPRTDATAGGDAEIADRIRPSANHDCRILPAPVDEGAHSEQRLAHVRTAWERDAAADASPAPPVLVDTPAGAGVDAATPLRVADGVIIVTTACAPALRDAVKTASMARAVGTPVVGVVLTRTAVRPPNATDLFEVPILGTVPEVSGRPLHNRRVRDRYDAVASTLGEVRKPALKD